jgi:aspartate/methionine/tyrosine aminotransferase
LRAFQPAARLQGIEKSVIRQIFERARPGSINLGLGEPDLPTPQVIREAAARVVKEEQNGYTAQAGLLSLRERIASNYPQLHATPNQVIVTAGSQEALYLALMTMIDHGDEVLIPDPGFVAYPTIVRMAGGVPVYYRLPAKDDFSFNLEEFKSRISSWTKAVICISPSNPTGRALSSEDLSSIAEALKDTGIYVISDEIYRDIYYTEDRPASISEHYQPTLVISGLSKSMSMTGWRLGWICGDEEVVKSALILHGYVTTCASAVSQKAALAAWTDESKEAREQIRKTFNQRRNFLIELISKELGLRVIKPDGAFYLMMDISKFGLSMRVAETLLEHNLITVPGGAFGEESEGFLRVSFCAEEDILREGVRRMKEALKIS